MQEQSLQRAAEIGGLLEFRLAPRRSEVVIHKHLAGAIDDDMGFAPAVVAHEVVADC